MSRHTIYLDDESHLVVGWDVPMETFFWQRYTQVALEDGTTDYDVAESEGDFYQQIQTVDALNERLEGNGFEPLRDWLKNVLQIERDAQPVLQRSPAKQEFFEKFIVNR